MLNVIRKGNMLTAAAFITWAAVSGMAFYITWLRDEQTLALTALAPLALTNLLAMWVAMDDVPYRPWRIGAAYAIQWLSALSMGWLISVNFLPIYTVIWIGMAASLWPGKPTAALLALTMVAWYAVMRWSWNYGDGALLTTVLYGTFHLFALFSARNATQAEQARDQVEALNRELVATQHLLSEASRQSERTRIARNLHDLLGHHLTALSINLQIAEHLTEGEAREKVSESRALTRLLLSDVRDAVSTLRAERTVDLERAVHLLVDNVPVLNIELDIAPELDIDNVEVAEAVLRCIQEALTNTLRHSAARHSWIRVWAADCQLNLEIRDDGEVSGSVDQGNGLTGIRERIEQLNGSCEFSVINSAMNLRAHIPLTVS